MAVAVASSLLLGLTSIAIDAVFGANSFTSSSRFGHSDVARIENARYIAAWAVETADQSKRHGRRWQ